MIIDRNRSNEGVVLVLSVENKRVVFVLSVENERVVFVLSVENERVVFCTLMVRNDILGLGISYDKIAAKEEAGACCGEYVSDNCTSIYN